MSRTSATGQAVLTRRDFVVSAAALGGGLALGIGLHAQEAGPRPAGSPTRSPTAFIQIAADDSITIVVPAVEMGQGAHTALPMIMMEELGGDWRKLKVTDAPADKLYDNPAFGGQQTVGSRTVRGWYAELRRLAAAAREMLVATAAQQWQVPASECRTADSSITHAASGRRVSYGSVAAAAARLPVPQQPALKKFEDFKVIGTSPGRVDVPAKVDGSAQFGIDKRLPDMLYGAVKCAPTLTGKLRSCDDSAARGLRGFHSTVKLEDGVIVLADSWWQAKSALEKVTAEYELGKLAGIDSAKVSSLLQGGFDETMKVAKNEGDVASALASAGTVMEAVYEVPYLAHACLEPMNCTAQVTADGCEVWCGTQSPQAAQAAAAAVLQIPAERVKVHAMYLGGGFGRRGPSDYVTQAVTAAKAAAGRPVKLIWSREEDIKHDWYRPAAAIRFRAGIAADASLTALECRVVSASAPGFEGPNSPPSYAGGVADMRYLIPNFRVTALNKDIGIRFGFWRSVNLSHNPFMVEGMLDEVAVRGKQDPYKFRRTLLQHERGLRQLGALDLAADKAGWGKAPAGHFQGIASLEGFGSFIASVVEVSVQDEKTIVIHRIVNAIDCGVAVHPANIVAQLDGGTIFGLTAVGRGEITLANGAVMQNNFNDYPMLHMAEAPRCESYIVPSREAPGGVGEPGTGPIAPALANAIFAATGTRIRSLPLSRHGFELAAARVRA